jgi:serine protease Do
MGYAMPIAVVQQVAKNLVTQGYVSGRAWLGVTVLQESNFLELQKLYRFPDGLYVSSVIKDSPAYTADLRKGDIITRINGNDVETHESLMLFLQSQAIGAMVDIEVYRKSDGNYHQLKVYLQEYQR